MINFNVKLKPMKSEKIKQLQVELKDLNTKHAALEVTVKEWNRKRRVIDEEIRRAETEMLALRVAAWRSYREAGEQLGMNL